MELRYAVLGLLYAAPMHGYALRQSVAPTLPKSQSINDGVLYPLIAKLEKDGLIEKKLEASSEGPARNVLHITEAGREEFLRWLDSDESERDEVTYDFFLRDSFLAKAAFLRHASPQERSAKFVHQAEVAQEKLQTLESVRKGMAEAGLSQLHLAIIDLALKQQRTRIQWLKQVSGLIETPDYVEVQGSPKG